MRQGYNIIWFRELLTELGRPPKAPTKVYVDNASLIILSKESSGNHKRVKHFLVRLNFLIQVVEAKIVDFKKVDTARNIVDPLTKPLGPVEFTPKTKEMRGPSTVRPHQVCHSAAAHPW